MYNLIKAPYRESLVALKIDMERAYDHMSFDL